MIQDIIYPKDRNDFRKWLFNNHDKCQGIWLAFFKKSSPKFNLSYQEARDEALCFGWIDSTVKKIATIVENNTFLQEEVTVFGQNLTEIKYKN